MSRKIDGNLTKSGPVPSLPLRRNHEKQSRIRGRKHMLYVVFPPRFNMFPFRFHLRNQVISSCVCENNYKVAFKRNGFVLYYFRASCNYVFFSNFKLQDNFVNILGALFDESQIKPLKSLV